MINFNASQRARLQAALGIWTLLEMVPPFTISYEMQ